MWSRWVHPNTKINFYYYDKKSLPIPQKKGPSVVNLPQWFMCHSIFSLQMMVTTRYYEDADASHGNYFSMPN